MKRLLFGLAGLLLVPFGCSGGDGDSAPESGTCAADNRVGDACAGVPSEQTADIDACSTVHTVAAASELEAVLSGTSPGDCVLLSAGSYSAVALPDGVSLFGESADAVTVEAITVESGTSRIADLASGTVTVRASAEANISGTRIEGSENDGLLLEQGARASVKRSEIVGAGRYGISAIDAASLELDGTIIADNTGPGMWIGCTDGCECNITVTASIKNTVVRNNRIVGISFVGASATLDNVVVSDTQVGSSFEAGGGVSASGCSDIEASALTIMSNADFGMLVDDSSLDMETSTIDSNLRGLWVQSIGATQASARVRVIETVLSGNEGVGFGVDKASVNVSIERSQITDTKLIPLPVLVNGVSANVLDVGDGLSWLGASQVTATDLSLSNNARVGVLIDGPVASGSAIANLTSSGTSGSLDLLQQNLPAGGEQPATSGTTPDIESDSSERLAIPSEIAIPPSI